MDGTVIRIVEAYLIAIVDVPHQLHPTVRCAVSNALGLAIAI